MSGLGPEARALLDAARDGLSPDAAAVRRMRANIGRAAAGGAAAGTAIGVKLGLLGLAVAVIVGTAAYVRRGGDPAEPPRLELAVAPEPPRQAATREPALPAAPDDALITIDPPAPGGPPRRAGEPPRGEPSAPSSHAAPPRAEPLEVTRDRAPAARDLSATAASEPGHAGLAREVELIDLAMAALRRGDPGEALRTVRQHAAETAGHGQLAEDAAAIEIEALCHLHAAAAGARLAAFDARFPRSAQRSRLTSRCP